MPEAWSPVEAEEMEAIDASEQNEGDRDLARQRTKRRLAKSRNEQGGLTRESKDCWR